MVHTGYDTNNGPLEKACYKRSREINEPFYKSRSLPFRDFGAVIVAWIRNEVTQRPIFAKSMKKIFVAQLFLSIGIIF